MKMSFLILSVLVLFGCSTNTVGTDFRVVNLTQLQPGKTTISEAKVLLGQPYAINKISGGVLVNWTYIHSSATLVGVDTDSRDLSIIFDNSEVMVRLFKLSGVEISDSERSRLFLSQ